MRARIADKKDTNQQIKRIRGERLVDEFSEAYKKFFKKRGFVQYKYHGMMPKRRIHDNEVKENVC